MHRITKRLLSMNKPRFSKSKGLAMFAIGAALGAGLAMWRETKSEQHDAGEGPVEVDL